jgi:dihydropyrimidinase
VTSLLVRGGRVLTADADRIADVLVEGEVVSEVGAAIDSRHADRVIDASGMYVLPGGVDPHTHMEMPFGGTTTCDDFTSGTTAAAFGGTTTIVDFCIQEPGQHFDDALVAWDEKITRCPPVIDVGFHLAVTDVDGGGGEEALAAVPARGVTSFKLFMAYKDALMVDDAAMFRVMRVAARTGSLVLVHAENGLVIDLLIREALAAGHVSPAWHGRTRPPATEAEATNRAIQLARMAGCRLYVVHVSCVPALAEVVRARARGWDVVAETCTQYLFVDSSALDAGSDFEGAKYVFTPPPRAPADRAALWTALADGTLSVLSSDHCAFRWADQKSLGRDDFSKIPNGGPTIEHRLHMLHHHGVLAGRFGLSRMVELFATEPARQFGLYPKKGTIAVGSDADLVVFDPRRELTISASEHHSRVDYNVFEGMTVRGAPHVVIARGRPIVEGGEIVGEPGGRFLQRHAVPPNHVFREPTPRRQEESVSSV